MFNKKLWEITFYTFLFKKKYYISLLIYYLLITYFTSWIKMIILGITEYLFLYYSGFFSDYDNMYKKIYGWYK